MQQLEENGQYKRTNNKMAVIITAGVYAANIANAIKEQASTYGWEISLFGTPVNVPISEWGPTLAKIRQDPPSVIAVTHFLPADLAQFMVQFVPNPTPSLIYMQYGPSIPAFRDIAKEASNGVLCTRRWWARCRTRSAPRSRLNALSRRKEGFESPRERQ